MFFLQDDFDVIERVYLIDIIDMTKTKSRVPGAAKIERQAM